MNKKILLIVIFVFVLTGAYFFSNRKMQNVGTVSKQDKAVMNKDVVIDDGVVNEEKNVATDVETENDQKQNTANVDIASIEDLSESFSEELDGLSADIDSLDSLGEDDSAINIDADFLEI